MGGECSGQNLGQVSWLPARARALTSPTERREQGGLVFAPTYLAQGKEEPETVPDEEEGEGDVRGPVCAASQGWLGVCAQVDTLLELPQDSSGYYLMACTVQLCLGTVISSTNCSTLIFL